MRGAGEDPVAPEGPGREEVPAGRAAGVGEGLSAAALLRGVAAWLVVGALLAVVPFFVLVRVAVAGWHGGLGAWGALVLGVLAIYLILVAWSWLLGYRAGPGRRGRRLLDRGAVALGVAFILYGLVWIGASNALDPAVRAEYRALHPVLRVATGLVFLADPGRVMAGPPREPEEYRLLGLSEEEASLHYLQEDGFVHALDLRTERRPEWGNRLVELGFWVLGFHTVRHRGIADHLHVSLRRGR